MAEEVVGPGILPQYTQAVLRRSRHVLDAGRLVCAGSPRSTDPNSPGSPSPAPYSSFVTSFQLVASRCSCRARDNALRICPTPCPMAYEFEECRFAFHAAWDRIRALKIFERMLGRGPEIDIGKWTHPAILIHQLASSPDWDGALWALPSRT